MKNQICIILLLCVKILSAQNSISDYIVLEKQISINDSTLFSTKYLYSEDFNTNEIAITFYNTQKDRDSVLFFILNTQTDRVSTESYFIKDLRESLINNYCETFDNISFSERYLTVTTGSYIYILDRHSKKIIQKLENKKASFESCTLFAQAKHFLMCKNYNHIGRKKTEFSIYSLPMLNKEYNQYPVFKDIKYTHLNPSHWISVSNHQILFAQTLDYSIEIFNQKLKKTHTITAPKTYTWKSLQSKDRKKIQHKKHPALAIQEMLKYENHINRIAGVYWVSDSTFIVNINEGVGQGDNPKYRYWFDVWRYSNQKWILKHERMKDPLFEETEFNKGKVSLLSDMMGRHYIFTPNYVYVLGYNVPIDLKAYDYENYTKNRNEYLYEKNPIFQIVKFKHRFDE